MSASATQKTDDEKSYYFVNRWVDYMMIGGITVIAFVFMLGAQSFIHPATAVAAGFYLQWVINFPHFSAGNYRFYSSKEHVMQYPVTAFALPVVLVLGMIGCFKFPALFTPFFISIYLLWSPYHFSAQSMGLTMLYGARTGFFIGKYERLALSTFIFGAYAVMYLRSGASLFASVASKDETTTMEAFNALFFDVPYTFFEQPPLLIGAIEGITYAAGAAFLFFFFRACKKAGKLLPLIALMPVLAHSLWFILGYKFGLAIFVAFVPLLHSLQYLLVTMSVHINSKLMQENEQRSSGKIVKSETIYWYITNLLGGFLLFGALPLVLMNIADTTLFFAVAVTYAAVQLHHFFIDGVIWKLRNNNTLGSPLMWNIGELASHREQERQAA